MIEVDLILPITRDWFDRIASGEKKEEYREIKPYYTSRFYNILGNEFGDVLHCQECSSSFILMLRNGYSTKSPYLISEVYLSKGRGKPEWGAPPREDVYILHIEDILEINLAP